MPTNPSLQLRKQGKPPSERTEEVADGSRHQAHHRSFALTLSMASAIALFLPTALYGVPTTTPRIGVVDEAGIIDPTTEQAINNILRDLEQSGVAQMRVLTIASAGGRDLHDYAMELSRHWKLGQEKADNGILMVIAHRDRKYETITGEGIEDDLTDSYLGDMQRRLLVPNFRRGDYSRGIYEAVGAIAARVAEKAGVTLTPATYKPAPRSSRGAGRVTGLACLAFVIMIIVALASARRRFGLQRNYRRGFGFGGPGAGNFLAGMLLGSLMNSGRRGGGGFSSGGFGGGFGGGGGGSFGGGGAGGSW